LAPAFGIADLGAVQTTPAGFMNFGTPIVRASQISEVLALWKIPATHDH